MHTISLVLGADRLALCGDEMQPPFRAARLLDDKDSAAGEQVTATLELALESPDPALLAAAVTRLEGLLSAARQAVQLGSGEPLYLACRRLASSTEWRARVSGGSLERKNGSAESGSLGLALRLAREAAWRGAETALELENMHGTGTSPRQVDNHSDSLHSATLDIPTRSVSGDLPALMRLRITNSDTGGQPVGRVWVGLTVYDVTPAYATVWEAEYGTGGEVRSDVPASNAYRRLSWSGADPATIWSYTLAQNEIPTQGGQTFALLARLVAPAPEGLWLKLRLVAAGSGALLDETGWSAVAAGGLHAQPGTLSIPPFRLPPGVGSALLRVELLAWVDAAGGHSLDLDFIALPGLEGMRRYDPLAPLPSGWSLEDDGSRDLCCSTFQDMALATHAPSGAALLLTPGRVNRLTILHEVVGTGNVNHSLTVAAWVTPRKRII